MAKLSAPCVLGACFRTSKSKRTYPAFRVLGQIKMSRRTFLFLLAGLVALLGAFDFGRHGATRPALPPGWKTVRWEAGFGSWCCGGYGVAYEISIPENYVFDQKCGTAWINADTDEGHDFLIKLVFDPGRKFSVSDFDNFMKS